MNIYLYCSQAYLFKMNICYTLQPCISFTWTSVIHCSHAYLLHEHLLYTAAMLIFYMNICYTLQTILSFTWTSVIHCRQSYLLHEHLLCTARRAWTSALKYYGADFWHILVYVPGGFLMVFLTNYIRPCLYIGIFFIYLCWGFDRPFSKTNQKLFLI